MLRELIGLTHPYRPPNLGGNQHGLKPLSSAKVLDVGSFSTPVYRDRILSTAVQSKWQAYPPPPLNLEGARIRPNGPGRGSVKALGVAGSANGGRFGACLLARLMPTAKGVVVVARRVSARISPMILGPLDMPATLSVSKKGLVGWRRWSSISPHSW